MGGGALLHYKLLREALDMQKADSGHRLAKHGPGMRRLLERNRRSGLLDVNAEIPRGPNTVAFDSPAQLQSLGLLGRLQP